MRPPFGEPYDWHRYSVGAALSSFDGDLDYAPLWAGESVEDVKDVRPAGALVRELADGAAALLR